MSVDEDQACSRLAVERFRQGLHRMASARELQARSLGWRGRENEARP